MDTAAVSTTLMNAEHPCWFFDGHIQKAAWVTRWAQRMLPTYPREWPAWLRQHPSWLALSGVKILFQLHGFCLHSLLSDMYAETFTRGQRNSSKDQEVNWPVPKETNLCPAQNLVLVSRPLRGTTRLISWLCFLCFILQFELWLQGSDFPNLQNLHNLKPTSDVHCVTGERALTCLWSPPFPQLIKKARTTSAGTSSSLVVSKSCWCAQPQTQIVLPFWSTCWALGTGSYFMWCASKWLINMKRS